jgi:inosine-uridine nucleoside N-ribohydrolase
MTHRPTQLILDTDLGGDIDDLGALALLHTLADHQQCEIAAVMSVTPQRPAVAAIAATNAYFGRAQIPIGLPRWTLEDQHTYADAVERAYPDAFHAAEKLDAVDLYRRILADAQPASVAIATIGQLFHLDHLLQSGADERSPLSGVELVATKVSRLVCMGGQHPRTSGPRVDPNFAGYDRPGVTRRVFERARCPLIVCTCDLGERHNGYGTGARLNELPDRHPLRIGYSHFFRHSPDWVNEPVTDHIRPWSIWDQITAMFAATPNTPWLGVDWSQQCFIDDRGASHWDTPVNRATGRLINRVSAAQLANDVIEPLMLGERPAMANFA